MLNNNIPKIIHYCWFGKNELPELAKKCIDSWKKNCPDYEIIEWNEKNFNINANKYVKEAYENKKWAFVSDYVRLFALVNYGGIYLDTDVEIIKSLDQLLNSKAFLGFENNTEISTGILACEKNCYFFKKILDSYEKRTFILKNGQLDLSTNVKLISDFCQEEGFILNNKFQKVNDIKLFPSDFFSPKNNETGEIAITENTYAIHYFSGSWLPKQEIFFIKLQNNLNKIFNSEIARKIVRIISCPYRIKRKINNIGIKATILFTINKILKRN